MTTDLPRRRLALRARTVDRLSLPEIISQAGADLDRIPVTIRVLIENAARLATVGRADSADVMELARWSPCSSRRYGVPYLPSRVVLQDFTGVPAIADLAAMRDAAAHAGLPPSSVDMRVRADLVVDHSLQVDVFGSPHALAANIEREYARNTERYAFLRWAQRAFRGLRVLPPGTGIVHQVHLERLADIVCVEPDHTGVPLAFAETVLGTDSHTPMINALGVLGWGVGGIEAEAVLLGQPLRILTPRAVGVRLTGALRPGTTATDLVLTVTETLRAHGVVGAYVEYCGDGVSRLSASDRATLANMTPEYGATTGLFPVDDETLHYLRMTGRTDDQMDLVERFCKEQGLFRTISDPLPDYDELLDLDLDRVEPCVAGPHRPQDRVPLGQVAASFARAYPQHPPAAVSGAQQHGGSTADGDVLIAAITSCTNTANPSVMLAAGLLARRAVKRGLAVPPWVKTSLAPGSRAVTGYLARAGLLPYLEKLGFAVVGYGCTTCNGMSGPLAATVTDTVGVAVLSGNRNFAGRVHPQIAACYLASPPLVVAYALAGAIGLDLTTQPLGTDAHGTPVHLADLWPTDVEIADAVEQSITPDLFREQYDGVLDGGDRWLSLPVPDGELFRWDPDSTYLRQPPFFAETETDHDAVRGARALLVLGDSISTDHISPVGTIAPDSAAGRYLTELGVASHDFNSYGTRRGNHEIMKRGTFGNVRLRNEMVHGSEGPVTAVQPSGDIVSVYEAACVYRKAGTPLIVIAGKEYGTGSSRDWAAKGTRMLGVRAVLAESFERIHRGNLVGMGVLPLQFTASQNRVSLGLDGTERFDLSLCGLAPAARLSMHITRADGSVTIFEVLARIDSDLELAYFRHGGVLPYALRQIASENPTP